MQFYQSEPAYVKFDYNIPRGASIGVYARRNALPTHTQYHFKEVLSGFNARTTRSTHVSEAQFLRLFSSSFILLEFLHRFIRMDLVYFVKFALMISICTSVLLFFFCSNRR